MRFNNIIETIGRTPLIKLNRLVPTGSADIYVKVESFNPGASVKDRIGIAMIEAAEKSGALKEGTTLIEPTSGNTGIALAMVAAAKGYRLILTMPESMSTERRALLKMLGAELVLTPKELGMKGAINKADELSALHGYLKLNQFSNPANPEIHRRTTALEIINDLEDINLDAYIAGVGTGGTISGGGEVLKQKYNAQIIAVEPEDSPVLSGGDPGPHPIQGIGAGFVPDNYNGKIIDRIIRVSESDAYHSTIELAQKEGILGGISSGANLWAALQVAEELGEGKTVVTFVCDTGERYISTKLFEQLHNESRSADAVNHQ